MTARYRAYWKLLHAEKYLELRLGVDPLSETRFERGNENTISVYDEILAASGASRVVDASKTYLKGVALYRARPDRVRIILLSRDGRAVLHSRVSRGEKRETAIAAWSNYYERALPLIRKHVRPADLLRVRYEDLASSPELELRRISSWLGVDYDPQMLAFRDVPQHLVNGNRMRLGGSNQIRFDDRWKRDMDPADVGFFERRSGSLNRTLGHV